MYIFANAESTLLKISWSIKVVCFLGDYGILIHFFVIHNDVIKWKHFPRYRPFVRGIHRSPVGSPHNGQWRGALMFSSICAWTNCWANNQDAGDLRRHHAHYDVTEMYINLWRNWLTLSDPRRHPATHCGSYASYWASALVGKDLIVWSVPAARTSRQCIPWDREGKYNMLNRNVSR